jgi:soluble lytic murein transglycosylase-like protein
MQMSAARRLHLVTVSLLLTWLALAGTSGAELVFLTSGRTLSVKAHRFEGESVVLTLRAGGQITCEAALVDRIEPDEVPHPEPEVIVPASAVDFSLPYAAIIDSAAGRAGVDPRLVHAVIRVESAYQAQARSRKGAMGLMQLMPETARRYSVSNPYDPGANIEAGTRHLKTLLDRLVELPLALAAYNAGEAAVERFRGIPPYPETQNYVRQVMRLAGAAR